MKRLILTALALAGGLLLLSSFSTTAQVIDGDACTDACYEQKSACVTECSEHRNPMDCESQCREVLQDCLRGCG